MLDRLEYELGEMYKGRKYQYLSIIKNPVSTLRGRFKRLLHNGILGATDVEWLGVFLVIWASIDTTSLKLTPLGAAAHRLLFDGILKLLSGASNFMNPFLYILIALLVIKNFPIDDIKKQLLSHAPRLVRWLEKAHNQIQALSEGARAKISSFFGSAIKEDGRAHFGVRNVGTKE